MFCHLITLQENVTSHDCTSLAPAMMKTERGKKERKSFSNAFPSFFSRNGKVSLTALSLCFNLLSYSQSFSSQNINHNYYTITIILLSSLESSINFLSTLNPLYSLTHLVLL